MIETDATKYLLLYYLSVIHYKSSLIPAQCDRWPWGKGCKEFNQIKMNLGQSEFGGRWGKRGVIFPFKFVQYYCKKEDFLFTVNNARYNVKTINNEVDFLWFHIVVHTLYF